MKNKGGMLRYKCRMCGEEFGETHVPDVQTAIIHLTVGIPLPWGGVPAHLLEIHSHEDGLGVADLIGGVEDAKP